jgi:O-methyltransferase
VAAQPPSPRADGIRADPRRQLVLLARRILGRADGGKGRAKRPPRIRPGTVVRWFDRLSFPLVVIFVLHDRQIHPAHQMTWRRRFEMAWRIRRITRTVTSGTTYRAHLAMASKILHFAPTEEGVVVECGSWKGSSTACLSVVCDYAQRRLVVYDSFEGMPRPDPRDEMGQAKAAGTFKGSLETVRETVRTHGVIERCSFRKGWFAETLPHHEEPVVLAYLDVDWQESLHDCMVNLWGHLVPTGYVFIDEFHHLRYCALFWSERWWRTYMDSEPPGLLGAGTGVGLGHFWVGPNDGKFGRSKWRPYQAGLSVAYTRRDFSGFWSFYPRE